jgi:hypothetical protein
MYKLGKILFILGFLWVCFFEIEIGPWARAAQRSHAAKLSDEQTYTRRDVAIAVANVSNEVVAFARFSFVGALLMLGGGIIANRAKKNEPAT